MRQSACCLLLTLLVSAAGCDTGEEFSLTPVTEEELSAAFAAAQPTLRQCAACHENSPSNRGVVRPTFLGEAGAEDDRLAIRQSTVVRGPLPLLSMTGEQHHGVRDYTRNESQALLAFLGGDARYEAVAARAVERCGPCHEEQAPRFLGAPGVDDNIATLMQPEFLRLRSSLFHRRFARLMGVGYGNHQGIRFSTEERAALARWLDAEWEHYAALWAERERQRREEGR